jgi:5-methylthioadenosine/S-adenosylhomocysteine deaminase
MSMLIEHVDYIITMDNEGKILRDGFVYVENGTIMMVGEHRKSKPPSAAETIDGRRLVMFPGLINTHTHSFQSLIRGLGDDKVLKDWLHEVTLPAAANLHPEHAYAGALLTFAMSLSSGVTTTLDYAYALPRAGVADGIIKAAQDLGIRLVFGRGVTDTGEKYGVPEQLMEDVSKALKDADRLVRTYEKQDGMVKIWVNPLTMWAISKDGLRALSDYVEETKTHVTVHLEETPFDVESAIDSLGERALSALERVGLLDRRVLGVHCIYLIEEDLKIMEKHQVPVSHNPLSNMYLSSGVAPVPAMMERGICISIGLDGPASNNSQDMLQGMKVTALLHKVTNPGRPLVITALDVLKMATIDGAKALGLDREIGSIEVGKRADFFLIDLKDLDTCPCYNPISMLVYSASKEDIRQVYVNGVKVFEDGFPTLVGKEEIVENAYKASYDLLQRAKIGVKTI